MLVPIIFLCLATFANGKLCKNNQYWSSILERCESCSRCVSPDIVLRPCEGNSDTVCGPLSELNLDWTWLKNHGAHSSGTSKHENFHNKMLDIFKENLDQIRQHEQHMKEKQRYLKRKHHHDSDEDEEDEDEIESGDIFVEHGHRFRKEDDDKSLWEKLKLLNKHRKLKEMMSDDTKPINDRNWNSLEEPNKSLKSWQKTHHPRSDGLRFNNKEALELLKSSRKPEKKENDAYDPNHLKFDENGILVKNFEFTKVEDNVKVEKLIDDSKFSEDFSTTEKFILDWQTVILGIAVSSCLVFFLVAAIYSVQHAKQWKKLLNYFDSDVEEIQSWMSSKTPEKKGSPSRIYKTTTEVVHTEGSHCKYLERIIRMNGKRRFNFVTGNVYEKDNKRPCELKPLTKKCLLVHKNVGSQL